jgi:hypothetical protein
VEARDDQVVDVRVKCFIPEAAYRMGFLHSEFGFTGPEIALDETGVYPLLRRVRFERADVAIEISLVLSYMGEEYVASNFVAADSAGSVRRTKIRQDTAHTGYQMRHALDLQAKAIRAALADNAPPVRAEPC